MYVCVLVNVVIFHVVRDQPLHVCLISTSPQAFLGADYGEGSNRTQSEISRLWQTRPTASRAAIKGFDFLPLETPGLKCFYFRNTNKLPYAARPFDNGISAVIEPPTPHGCTVTRPGSAFMSDKSVTTSVYGK